MRKLIPTALLGVASATAIGLIGMQAPTVQAADDAGKREDDLVELVLVADDDDDDTNDDDSADTRTGQSRDSNDNTNSRYSMVSRDKDRSRGDKTRDWTRDGKTDKKKRDWTAGSTNDRSRNDTRG